MFVFVIIFLFIFAFRNALNIVKDDLIVKVDELTGEIEILREELNTANQSRAKMRQKISELEDELKQSKTLVKANSMCHVISHGIETNDLNNSSANFSLHLQIVPIKRMKVMFLWLSVSVSLELKWLAF